MLRKLGADIHDARRRRRLPMGIVAERAFTSRTTLQRIEEGDPGVGIGIYAAVLQALGLLEGLVKSPTLVETTSGRRSRPPSFPHACACAGPLQRVPMPDIEVHIDLDGEPGASACFAATSCVERKQSPSNMTMAG